MFIREIRVKVFVFISNFSSLLDWRLKFSPPKFVFIREIRVSVVVFKSGSSVTLAWYSFGGPGAGSTVNAESSLGWNEIENDGTSEIGNGVDTLAPSG